MDLGSFYSRLNVAPGITGGYGGGPGISGGYVPPSGLTGGYNAPGSITDTGSRPTDNNPAKFLRKPGGAGGYFVPGDLYGSMAQTVNNVEGSGVVNPGANKGAMDAWQGTVLGGGGYANAQGPAMDAWRNSLKLGQIGMATGGNAAAGSKPNATGGVTYGNGIAPMGTVPGSPAALAGGVGGAGGANGTAGSGQPGDIASQIQAQFDKANAANQVRYDQLTGLAQGGRGEQMDALNNAYNGPGGIFSSTNGMGDAERELAKRTLAEQKGGEQQKLVNSGLYNSTVDMGVNRGFDADYQLRNQQIDQAINQVRSGQQLQYSNSQQGILGDTRRELEGIIERRTDQGPDLNAWANLLQHPTGPLPSLPFGMGGGGAQSGRGLIGQTQTNPDWLAQQNAQGGAPQQQKSPFSYTDQWTDYGSGPPMPGTGGNPSDLVNSGTPATGGVQDFLNGAANPSMGGTGSPGMDQYNSGQNLIQSSPDLGGLSQQLSQLYQNMPWLQRGGGSPVGYL